MNGRPDKPALITPERTVTYAELDRSVNALAHHLLDRGLRPGDRVAVYSPNSIESVELILAAFRAGLIAVPVNVRLKAPELAYILRHSEARVCFSEPAFAPIAAQAAIGTDVQVLGELPPLTDPGPPLPEVDPDQPAVILYTSGTTAQPKGVTHTHRSMYASARALSLGPDDIVLTTTQIAHASGLLCMLLPGLVKGGSVVLQRLFDPAVALDLIERFRCTYTGALPAMARFIVEEQARRPRDVSSLRTFIAGGDTVPVTLQERFQSLFGIALREVYGMTESVPVTFNPVGAIRTGSMGRIMEGVEVRIAGGETGEIQVRSAMNCAGYWRDPSATAALFDGDWLRTGDLACRDADGYYWFRGRLKQIIIRGGSNISPQEVEEALYRHPAVLEAGVVGTPDPVYGQTPVAFVVLRHAHAVTEDALRAHAGTLLSDYKVPERIFFLTELPKGLTGKVDRRRLRGVLEAQPELLETAALAGAA